MNIVEKAERFARKEYLKNDSFHQYIHVENVLKRAYEIVHRLKGVNIDEEALTLAIIFHDIDYSAYETHPDVSAEIAGKWLKDNDYPKDKIIKVKNIILDHSTPHREIRRDAKTIEGKIIFDSDKSLFITTPETYQKYFSLLYLQETKDLVTYRP